MRTTAVLLVFVAGTSGRVSEETCGDLPPCNQNTHCCVQICNDLVNNFDAFYCKQSTFRCDPKGATNPAPNTDGGTCQDERGTTGYAVKITVATFAGLFGAFSLATFIKYLCDGTSKFCRSAGHRGGGNAFAVLCMFLTLVSFTAQTATMIGNGSMAQWKKAGPDSSLGVYRFSYTGIINPTTSPETYEEELSVRSFWDLSKCPETTGKAQGVKALTVIGFVFGFVIAVIYTLNATTDFVTTIPGVAKWLNVLEASFLIAMFAVMVAWWTVGDCNREPPKTTDPVLGEPDIGFGIPVTFLCFFVHFLLAIFQCCTPERVFGEYTAPPVENEPTKADDPEEELPEKQQEGEISKQ